MISAKVSGWLAELCGGQNSKLSLNTARIDSSTFAILLASINFAVARTLGSPCPSERPRGGQELDFASSTCAVGRGVLQASGIELVQLRRPMRNLHASTISVLMLGVLLGFSIAC